MLQPVGMHVLQMGLIFYFQNDLSNHHAYLSNEINPSWSKAKSPVFFVETFCTIDRWIFAQKENFNNVSKP